MPQNTTIQNIILLSGILEKYTEIDLRENKVGIFSRPAKLNETVDDGDRIEIYRPLIADPKEIRRKKQKNRQMEKNSLFCLKFIFAINLCHRQASILKIEACFITLFISIMIYRVRLLCRQRLQNAQILSTQMILHVHD